MLPKFNRNQSVMNNNTSMGYHSLANNGVETSPLKLFSKAKQAINSIYNEFDSFLGEIYSFVDSPDMVNSVLIEKQEQDDLKSFKDKLDGLSRMISRDRMKCVFFGRTSNGKSTVINSMLREKILPTGIGHTTHCFLQVEGCDSTDDPCIFTPGNENSMAITNLNTLGSALSDEKLDSSCLVRVLWPKEKCHLLKEDVVFVDSPGIDVTTDLDSWIDQQCMDADVFVLVVNAEATLTKTEKEFFYKVSEKLSKPNVFILNNRWDATAYELETAEEVKKQHMERGTEFLVKELKVCDPKEANNRIYFVSAREALFSRTQNNPQFPPGYQSRLLQFEWFEAEFEKTISMSAVKTKFEQPSQKGQNMVSMLRKTLDNSHQKATDKKLDNERSLKEIIQKIEVIEKKLQDFTQEMKDKIRNVMENVEKNVSMTLNDEIKKVYNLIEQYERPFHPEEHQLNWYKKELHKFVEQKLGSNLSSRLNNALIKNLEMTQNEIRNHVLELVVSEENQKLVSSCLPRSDFMINYRLDCSNLCSDFKEDIGFHFSLGFTSLMKRFSGNKSTAALFQTSASRFLQQNMSGGKTVDEDKAYHKEMMSRQMSHGSNLNSFAPANNQTDHANNLLVLLQGFQMVTSKSNVVLIAVGGVVWRGLGWRILAITGSMYGLCYLYERLMWTRKTQEKLFKKQYADYASSKLKLIVDLTSQNAACQVQQELSMYFAQMCRYIDITRDEYFKDMKQHEKDIKVLGSILSNLKILRNKGKYIHDDFEKFNEGYLQNLSSVSLDD